MLVRVICCVDKASRLFGYEGLLRDRGTDGIGDDDGNDDYDDNEILYQRGINSSLYRL